jgi:hypothetical protein
MDLCNYKYEWVSKYKYKEHDSKCDGSQSERREMR